jgi:NADP-dependent 3-hydroxy acid dehydrogenase YdfG
MPDAPVFVITGASSGIGAATARRAAAAGYRLVLAGRAEAPLRAMARELGGEGRALPVSCDVTEWEQVTGLAERTLEAFGRADLVLANAGTVAEAGFTRSEPERWRAMVLTNVYGVALTVRAFLEPLKGVEGHLLFTGSVAGRRTLPGSLYGATKWALTGLVDAVREELRGTGVRVTLVQPGKVSPAGSDGLPPEALAADDVARALMYAIAQPAHVDVNEIIVRPTVPRGRPVTAPAPPSPPSR